MPQKPSATVTRQQNRQIAAISARLLAHYWTAEELAAVRQAQVEDWIDDLHEFPIERVAEACREYRRGPLRSHRPIPGDIRALCIAAEIAEREQLAIADDRAKRWPRWLAETWGPEPEGPRRRAAALERDAQRARGEANV